MFIVAFILLHRRAIGLFIVYLIEYVILSLFLIFISLQALDIEFMKHLHDRVNIIPVIAKADTLTSEELRLFKKSIMQDIANEKMNLYEFPECDDDDDENKLTKIYKNKVPFAVVGSNFILDKGNRRTRARQYAWGIVDGRTIFVFLIELKSIFGFFQSKMKFIVILLHYGVC